jgi:hypothetical protein
MSNSVTCPICGDYDGEISSVKSHITGSKGDHEGKTGQQYADVLEARADGDEPDAQNLDSTETADSDTGETPDGGEETGGSDAEESEESEESEEETADADQTDSDMATPEEYEQQGDVASDDGSDTDDGDGDDAPDTTPAPSAGMLEEIPTAYLLAGICLAAIVAYLMLYDDGSSGAEPVDAPADTGDSDGSGDEQDTTGVVVR